MKFILSKLRTLLGAFTRELLGFCLDCREGQYKRAFRLPSYFPSFMNPMILCPAGTPSWRFIFALLSNAIRAFRLVALLISAVGFNACAPSVRAINALNRGDYCEFCRISASAADTEPNSMHNMGLCYEKGWCGYKQSKDFAIKKYTQGARWGVQESRDALIRLGVEPPIADLKIAQDLADARERAAMWGAVAATLANSANTLNNQPTYNSYQGNQVNTFAPALNYQGCCSYHMGINKDVYGNVNCHLTGAVLCNDFQPSPTCRCN